MQEYTEKTKRLMQLHFSRLSEKDRRRYAAMEALRFGSGGTTDISKVLGSDRNTIMKGKKALLDLAGYQQIPPGCCRRPGGGRKKKTQDPDMKRMLTALSERPKAGRPPQAHVYRLSLKPCALANLFYEQPQIKVSNGLVKRLLKESGYGYGKQSKQLASGSYALRDEQFGRICSLVLLMSVASPGLGIDCKKKERLGNLYREGKGDCTEAVKVYAHDYEHRSKGKVIPHGIYDLPANKGYISIGSSSETADCVVDNLLWWWFEYGIHLYADAKNILLRCDAGGANSYRHYAFKVKLMAFATETGLSVIVCHYPPYCSKCNPIEHRFFCQVHRAMEGVVFSAYPTLFKSS